MSAIEWIDSASIDADPVTANAANFETRDAEVREERGKDRPPGSVMHRRRPTPTRSSTRVIVPSVAESRTIDDPARSPRSGR